MLVGVSHPMRCQAVATQDADQPETAGGTLEAVVLEDDSAKARGRAAVEGDGRRLPPGREQPPGWPESLQRTTFVCFICLIQYDKGRTREPRANVF